MTELPVQPLPGETLVWTDGACKGNPGPGGWAAIVVSPEATVELSGGEPHSTNNRMEYMAALEGLRSPPAGRRPCVVTESRLMRRSMQPRVHGRIRQGWRAEGTGGEQTRPHPH